MLVYPRIITYAPFFRLSPEAATNDTGNRSPSALLTALQHAPGRGEISGGDVLLQKWMVQYNSNAKQS